MGSVDPSALSNLHPRTLVGRLTSMPRADVVPVFSVPLLLVRLEDTDGELARALARLSETGIARIEPGMGFHTVSTDRRALRPPSVSPPAALAPEQILVRVIRAPHFVVLVGKRPDAGGAFAERVSVGRTRNADVVLRDPSVSKSHAWFARDEDGQYFVADANSRNGTWKNDVALRAVDPVRVSSGDLLRFGTVECTFCDAITLYDALRA